MPAIPFDTRVHGKTQAALGPRPIPMGGYDTRGYRYYRYHAWDAESALKREPYWDAESALKREPYSSWRLPQVLP